MGLNEKELYDFVNEKDNKYGSTPLHIACENKTFKLKEFNYLITNCKANIKELDSRNYDCYWYVVGRNDRPSKLVDDDVFVFVSKQLKYSIHWEYGTGTRKYAEQQCAHRYGKKQITVDFLVIFIFLLEKTKIQQRK